MAFSTFRGLMAASNATVTPPPTLTDLFGQNAPCGWATLDMWICSGTSTAYYATRGDGTAWIVNKGAGYTYLSSQTSINAPSSLPYVVCSTITSTSFLAVTDSASNHATAEYIVNSSGTLSVSAGPTNVLTGVSTFGQILSVVLDTSNALIFGSSGGGSSDNYLSLINPTTLSAHQSSTSIGTFTNATNCGLYFISPTLAAFTYVNGSNQILIASVTVVSGTSFTVNTPYNTSITASTTAIPVLYAITTTTALMAYYKTTNTLAVRVVTFSGGSVSLGTEYTTTANHIYSEVSPFTIASYNSGNKYLIAYGETGSSPNYYGGRIWGIEVTVSGTTVNFGTNGFSLIGTSPGYLYNPNWTSSSYNVGQLIQVDSNHLAMYVPTHAGYTTFIEVNPSTQTWGTFSGTNGQFNTGSFNSANQNMDILCLGGDKFLLSGNSNSTSSPSPYYVFDTAGGTSNSLLQHSTTNNSTNGSVPAMSLLSYDPTNGYSRVLSMYCASSGGVNNVALYVVTIDGTNTITEHTGTGSSLTITYANIQINESGQYWVLPLASDTTMGLIVDGDTGTGSVGALKASIITTSNVTVSSVGSLNTIYSTTNDYIQIGAAAPQWYVIDSTHVAIMYCIFHNSTSKYDLQLVIASVSGTTVTAGTPVTIASGMTNKPANFGVTILNGGGKGIVTYTNDASPATIIYANGFTYSGTTITLGSQNTIVSGTNIVSSPSYFNNNGNNTILTLSGTEAMYCYYNSSTSVVYTVMLTYVSNSSITAGTPVSVITANGNQGMGLVASDLFNDTFMVYAPASGLTFTQYYRS